MIAGIAVRRRGEARELPADDRLAQRVRSRRCNAARDLLRHAAAAVFLVRGRGQSARDRHRRSVPERKLAARPPPFRAYYTESGVRVIYRATSQGSTIRPLPTSSRVGNERPMRPRHRMLASSSSQAPMVELVPVCEIRTDSDYHDASLPRKA
jgi:hypothetical protein